jgi:hypothetical protein
MNSLTTFDDMNNFMIVDCQNINIYMILIIISLVFLLIINWIYFVYFRIKSKTDMEIKVDKIDKNIVNLMKIFRELKKID